MKQLFFFRNAKAIKLSIGIADIERKLSLKGNKDAKIMAHRLRIWGYNPELIIASPANRALETARILANEIKYPASKIVQEPLLYSDNEKKVRNLLKTVEDKYHSILIVGHNPLLEEMIGYFTGKPEIKLTTSSCCCVEFKANSWKKISKASGEVKLLDFPANQAEQGLISRQVRKNLAQLLSAEVENELKEIDVTAYEVSQPIIRSSIRKVVKKFVKSLKFENLAKLSRNLQTGPAPEGTPKADPAATPEPLTPPENGDIQEK